MKCLRRLGQRCDEKLTPAQQPEAQNRKHHVFRIAGFASGQSSGRRSRTSVTLLGDRVQSSGCNCLLEVFVASAILWTSQLLLAPQVVCWLLGHQSMPNFFCILSTPGPHHGMGPTNRLCQYPPTVRQSRIIFCTRRVRDCWQVRCHSSSSLSSCVGRVFAGLRS